MFVDYIDGESVPKRRDLKIRTMLEIAENISLLSTCVGTQVGAILTDSNFCILSSGFNGAPSGFPHCCEEQNKDDHDQSFELHAECNCITRADNHFALNGELYLFCTHLPCIECAKIIVSGKSRLNVEKIYYRKVYSTKKPGGIKAPDVIAFLKKAQIETFHYDGAEKNYENFVLSQL